MTRKYTKVLCVMIALALMAVMFAGCSQKQLPEQTDPANEPQGSTAPPADTNPISPEEPSTPADTQPEDAPVTQPPTEPPVQVTLPAYELSYSGELADRISWKELEDRNGLQFFVRLTDGDAAIFTMLVNQEEGDLVVMKQNSAEEQIPIAFQMKTLPEGLSQEEQDVFFFAQDKVNEIASSLTLK